MVTRKQPNKTTVNFNSFTIMPLPKYQPYKQHKSRLIVPISLLAMVVISALSVTALYANDLVPHEVGGFSLGSDINEYPEVVASNFLQETVVTDRYGFRKGIISTGVCKYPDKILKMRLKYEDSDKKFFQKLLKEYKKKYGAPHEWKGDSFGIVHIWKWHFTDSENRKVSLSLQHNLKNINENIGNLVKLSYPELVEEERACFNQMCEEKKKDQDVNKREELKQPDWDYMIPK